MEILEEERTVLADAASGVGLGDGSSLGGGVLSTIGGVEDLSGRHCGCDNGDKRSAVVPE